MVQRRAEPSGFFGVMAHPRIVEAGIVMFLVAYSANRIVDSKTMCVRGCQIFSTCQTKIIIKRLAALISFTAKN